MLDIKILELLSKENIYKFCATLIVVALFFFTIKQTNFVILNTNKNVRFELYDICLDSLAINENELFELATTPRPPKYIVIHTTASIKDQSAADLRKIFNERWGVGSRPGYNYVINTKGDLYVFSPIDNSKFIEKREIVNGARGFNSISIHIALTAISKETSWNDLPIKQKKTLLVLLHKFKHQFPRAEIVGHRNLAQVKKTCPNFDAKKTFNYLKNI